MSTKSEINNLKKAIFKERPILKKVFSRSGGLSLYDYANSWKYRPIASDARFKDVFLKALESQLPKGIASKVMGQLIKIPLVSTIDHHGILNHPFFVNSNLIFSLRGGLQYLIVLSTEGVSLNNSSWPGCLMYHEGRELKRFSIFADKEKNKTVFAKKGFNKKEAVALLEKINNPKVKDLAKEIILSPDILRRQQFSGQISLINYLLWNKIFPKAPQVVYLPLESLVSKVISKIICKDKNHVLHRLLFTKKGWQLMENHFSGLKGAFAKDGKGSFLFWAVNKKGRRIAMRRKGPRITDGGFLKIDLKPDIISRAFKARQIYPTSLVCFLVLLYYQITCLGGFNQITWLTDIKKRFVLLLKKLGEYDLAKTIQAVPTDNFAEGNLAFLRHQGRLVKATGLDIYLSSKNIYTKYQKLSRIIFLKQSIETLFPEMYRIILAKHERRADLLKISDEDLAIKSGLKKKVAKALSG